MKKVLGVVILVVVAWLIYWGINKNDDRMEMSDEMMEGDHMESDEMMNDDVVEEGQVIMNDEMVSAGSYVNYEDVTIADIEGTIVLAFLAPWCPTCRAFESDLKASLSDIPTGVTIVKVDYDSSTDLKKQYGITQQHTFVQVDAAGTMIKKWSGSGTLEAFSAQIS